MLLVSTNTIQTTNQIDAFPDVLAFQQDNRLSIAKLNQNQSTNQISEKMLVLIYTSQLIIFFCRKPVKFDCRFLL